MNSIIMYLNDIISYVIIILPIFCIFRIVNIKNKYHGKFNIYYEICLCIFVICLIGILSQTIIPKFVYINGKIKFIAFLDKFNFIPFKILYKTYIQITKYSNYTHFLINIVGNICMFIPLGILLPLLNDKYKNLKSTVMFGCILSICIELIQIVLPRITDIDDVILNTLGTLIGYVIFVFMKNIFPRFIQKFNSIDILDVIKLENKNKENYALITGASSGIGYKMAIKLSNLGFNIIAVARNSQKLIELRNTCNTNVEIMCTDLQIQENVYKLYDSIKDKNITVVINNAGFGIYGKFSNTNLDEEINMINLNIKCVHILTKLFLKDMLEKNEGYILNVASSAAFMPSGPFMSTYYATKKYILSLTNAISLELKKKGSNVCISTLCLGPTKTNFNKNAKIHASLKQMDCQYVTEVAIKDLFLKNKIIIPGINNKMLKFITKIVPDNILMQINYIIQKNKKG